MNFDALLSKIDLKAPEIFFGVGCVGIFTTVASTIFATNTMSLKMEEINAQNLEPKERKKVIFKEGLKTYWPVAANVALTLFSFGESKKIEHERLVSTAAALAVTSDSLKTFKEKTKEVVGENNFKKVEDKIAEEKIANTPANAYIYETGHGSYLCKDDFTGCVFRCDVDELEKVRARLNNRFNNEMFISINDFLYELNLPVVGAGRDNGWDINKRNTISFDYKYGPHPVTGEPMLIICYDVDSRYDYSRLG